MRQEMLQTQQYLGLHPILAKGEGIREKYASLLSHFVMQQDGGDLWAEKLHRFYISKIVGEGGRADPSEPRKLNLIEQFRFTKYRYYLLTDCLFISAFDDRERGGAICEEFAGFFGERYRKKFSMILEAFYDEAGGEMGRGLGELAEIYKIIWNNRRFIKEPPRKVMITATMSAGKSTLLNALAGKEVSKTQSLACTAKIHYLINKAGEDGLSYELDHELELDASHEVLMTDNEENDSESIYVGTRFRSLTEIDRSVWLIDTPGVNSSMNKEHREMARKAIQSTDCDILLFLFNGENMATVDEFEHLKFVVENFADPSRIIFLVNRLDHFKKKKDSVEKTLDVARAELKKLGVDNPRIYPLSAYAAYLAKMRLYGEELKEYELDDLEFLKGRLKMEELSYERHYPVRANADCRDGELGTLLLHSGILSLEQILYK